MTSSCFLISRPVGCHLSSGWTVILAKLAIEVCQKWAAATLSVQTNSVISSGVFCSSISVPTPWMGLSCQIRGISHGAHHCHLQFFVCSLLLACCNGHCLCHHSASSWSLLSVVSNCCCQLSCWTWICYCFFSLRTPVVAGNASYLVLVSCTFVCCQLSCWACRIQLWMLSLACCNTTAVIPCCIVLHCQPFCWAFCFPMVRVHHGHL